MKANNLTQDENHETKKKKRNLSKQNEKNQ